MRALVKGIMVALPVLGGCVTTQQIEKTIIELPGSDGVPSEGTLLAMFDAPVAAEPANPEAITAAFRDVKASSNGFAPIGGLETYTQRVLDRIVAAAPDGAPPARAYLLANVSPGALARPEGLVFINHSAFDYLQNEDQLAFLLAHEYSHVYLGHEPGNWLRSMRPYLLTAIDITVRAQEGDDQFRDAARLYGSDVLLRDMLMPVWDRKLERQADHLGIDLMVAAGYNPTEAIKSLSVVKTYESSVEALHAEEKNALERSLEAELSAQPTGDLIGDIAQALKTAIADVQVTLAKRHDDAGERMKLLYGYINREHAAAKRRGLQSEAFAEAIRQTGHMLEQYRSAHLIKGNVEQPDARIDRALVNRARKAVAGNLSKHPYTRNAFALLRAQQGNYRLALRNLELVETDDGFLALPLEVRRAQWLEREGDSERAAARLEEVAMHYDWPLMAYQALIPMLERMQAADRVRALKLNCVARYPQSRRACALDDAGA